MVELGYRAHQILPLGEQLYLVIGRRPETWMAWVDFTGRTISSAHEVESGCHLYGHAAIDRQNNILITAENDTVERRGQVVLRDMATLVVVERYPSYGLGPHQIVLDPQTQRLWVANGGFLLEPQTGRAIRNRGSFQSQLVMMDYQSGRKLEAVQHPDRQQSIRHLALLDQDTVAIGLQHHGDGMPGSSAAYAVWSPGQAIHTFSNQQPRQNYVTTIITVDQQHFAVSMEKDHCVALIHREHGLVQASSAPVPQGLALAGSDLLVTCQGGGLLVWPDIHSGTIPEQLKVLPQGFWFDNHFITA